MLVKTNKQLEALELIKKNTKVLLTGGSRSGKSVLAVHVIVTRALLFTNSTHLIIRKFNNSLRRSIWNQTLPFIIFCYELKGKIKIDQTSMTVTFPNNSKIICIGADNPKSMDRILGIEASSIVIDEASEIDYSQFELIQSRLAEKKCTRNLIILCTNPTVKSNWIYRYFIEKVYPIDRLSHNVPVVYLKMNPDDNLMNIADGYIETLKQLSERQRQRFYEGEWLNEIIGALWKYDMIDKHRRIAPTEYDRIVIGVDPAVTNTDKSDSTGIIVAGEKDKEYYILRDETFKGSPNEVVHKILALRRLYKADKVIVETNQGSDWILSAIDNADRNCPVVGIHSKSSKMVRAEAPAYLYEKGLVHHTQVFKDLEDQMVSYTGTGESPDNLDALVFALNELSFTEEQTLDLAFCK